MNVKQLDQTKYKLFLILFCPCNTLEKYEDAELFDRLTLIEKEFPGTSVLLHKMGNLPEVSTVYNNCMRHLGLIHCAQGKSWKTFSFDW